MCEQHCGRPSDVYTTDRRTKLTALETISRGVILKKWKKRSLSHPLGHLGVTYTVHLWLVEKPVVDFIFVVIELFLLSPMVETLWAEIGWSRRFSKGGGSLWTQISEGRGRRRSPTNHSWYQSSREIALSCGIKISAVRHWVLSQSMGVVTDRQTDGQTDKQNYDSQDRTSIAASRGRNMLIKISYTKTAPKRLSVKKKLTVLSST